MSSVAGFSCVRIDSIRNEFLGDRGICSAILELFDALVEASRDRSRILRSIRLLRVFRVLKLWRNEMSKRRVVRRSDLAEPRRSSVFLSVGLGLPVSDQAERWMYHIETVMKGFDSERGSSSVPQSMLCDRDGDNVRLPATLVPQHHDRQRSISAVFVTGLIALTRSRARSSLTRGIHRAMNRPYLKPITNPCPKCAGDRSIAANGRNTAYLRCGAPLRTPELAGL